MARLMGGLHSGTGVGVGAGGGEGSPECSVAALVKEGVLEKVCGDADPQLREFAREEAGEQQDPGAEYLLLPLDQPAHLIHFGRHVCGGRDVSNETSDENARVLGLQIACVLNSPFVRCGRNKGGGLVAGAQRGL